MAVWKVHLQVEAGNLDGPRPQVKNPMPMSQRCPLLQHHCTRGIITITAAPGPQTQPLSRAV